jgi:tetratricopeptide (TPR) repeat protein
VGEPVILVVKLRNKGKEPVPFHTAHLGVDYETAAVQIVAPGSRKEVEYKTWFVIEPSAPSFALAPGDTSSFSQMLHWNARTDRLVFPVSGTYKVSVQIYNLTGKKDLKSERASVQIVEAKAAGDRKLQSLMAERKTAGFLAGVTEPDKDLLARYHRLAKEHPQSKFTPYIHYALGLYYSREYFKRQPNFKKAQKHFRQALELSGPGHPLQLKLLGLMAGQAAREGKADEAKRLLEEAGKVWTGDLELMRVERMVKKRSSR